MPQHFSRVVVEKNVNQLVEAQHDRDAARNDLEVFQAAHPAPEPPAEFENLSSFLDYHDRRREYEDEVERREKSLATAETRYTQAAETLREVLPENVHLRYDYAGLRHHLYGYRYGIVNTQGEVVISSTESPAASTRQNQ